MEVGELGEGGAGLEVCASCSDGVFVGGGEGGSEGGAPAPVFLSLLLLDLGVGVKVGVGLLVVGPVLEVSLSDGLRAEQPFAEVEGQEQLAGGRAGAEDGEAAGGLEGGRGERAGLGRRRRRRAAVAGQLVPFQTQVAPVGLGRDVLVVFALRGAVDAAGGALAVDHLAAHETEVAEHADLAGAGAGAIVIVKLEGRGLVGRSDKVWGRRGRLARLGGVCGVAAGCEGLHEHGLSLRGAGRCGRWGYAELFSNSRPKG